jgi:shikimate dehydrogenase
VTTIVNRDRARADRLAGDVGARSAELDEARRAADYDIVVNATTVGQVHASGETAASPVPAASLRAGQVVMDIVYKPIRTTLVESARDRGATVIHGGRMLLHQAAAQFELYTGRPAPLGALEAALNRAIQP